MEAMIRTPKDTPTATPILIPSLFSGDALPVLEEGGEEGVIVDVEEVSVDDSEDIDGIAVGDTVSVTVSVFVSVSVSFVDCVVVAVTMLCELVLIELDRKSIPHSYRYYSPQSRIPNESEGYKAFWETYCPCSSGTIAKSIIFAAVRIRIVALDQNNAIISSIWGHR